MQVSLAFSRAGLLDWQFAHVVGTTCPGTATKRCTKRDEKRHLTPDTLQTSKLELGRNTFVIT